MDKKFRKDFPLFSMCSLYPKNERMICACFLGKDKKVVEDMERLGADYLMWSALVSGSISLSDLKQEGWGKRSWDKEGRCDVEFIKECHEKGIKVFGVIFTAQGYEIGMDIKDGKMVNFGKGEKFWGLQEFYKNEYPQFGGWKDFFPTPLFDEKGEEIEDFIKECACRDIHQNISYSLWTQETPKYFNIRVYLMCKNSPHWMKYLKKQIEILISAEVDGILFDETASPYETSILGGFCKYCMQNFAQYLTEKYKQDFSSFNYAEFLRKKGWGKVAVLGNFKDLPYGDDFRLFQIKRVRENFQELIHFAQDYARNKNKEILTCGNFVELLPFYLPLIEDSSLINLETLHKYPPLDNNIPIYKLGRSAAKDKPLTCVPSVVNASYQRRKEKQNLMKNLERYLIAEAASSQGNYQIPYSCFTIEGEGAYYPNIEHLVSFQKFIKEHPEFYLAEPEAVVSLIFSYPSYLWTFNWITFPGKHFLIFSGTLNLLINSYIPFEVVIWGDGDYFPEFYQEPKSSILIFPRVTHLTKNQKERITKYAKQNRKLLIIGDFNLYNEKNGKLSENSFSSFNLYYLKEVLPLSYAQDRKKVSNEFNLLMEKILPKPLFKFIFSPKIWTFIYKNQDKFYLHLLNKNYIPQTDSFIKTRGEIEVIKDLSFKKILFYQPDKKVQELELKNSKINIPPFEIYAVLELVKEV